jgi:hypothetical protein
MNQHSLSNLLRFSKSQELLEYQQFFFSVARRPRIQQHPVSILEKIR